MLPRYAGRAAYFKQPKEIAMSNEAKCPFSGDAHTSTVAGSRSNADWWPNQLKLNILHQQSSLSDPMGEAFNYTEEFKSLDLKAVKQDFEVWQAQQGVRK